MVKPGEWPWKVGRYRAAVLPRNILKAETESRWVLENRLRRPENVQRQTWVGVLTWRNSEERQRVLLLSLFGRFSFRIRPWTLCGLNTSIEWLARVFHILEVPHEHLFRCSHTSTVCLEICDPFLILPSSIATTVSLLLCNSGGRITCFLTYVLIYLVTCVRTYVLSY